MTKIFFILIGFSFVSCGRDGRDGAPGTPSDPLPPPIAPLPPEDLEETITCNLNWQLTGEPAGRAYEISYVVYKAKNKDKFVTLRTAYRTPKTRLTPEQTEVKYKPGEGREDEAYVSSFQWQATLSGKTALIKRIPFNETKEVLCK